MKTHQRVATGIALLVGITTALQAQIITERPTLGTPTIMLAGPSWFQAGSDFPAHIKVVWAPVANAVAYRPYRSDDGVNFYRAGFWKMDVWPLDPNTGGIWGEQWLSNADPVTHWFGIKAVFINGRDTTESMMSPVAAVQSVPNVAPSGLQYSVTPSTVKPGSLRIGLSWNASYPAAIGYHVRFYKRHTVLFEIDRTPHTSIIVDEPGAPGYTVGGNLFFYSFRPKQTIEGCVYTRYYSTNISSSPPSCVTIQL